MGARERSKEYYEKYHGTEKAKKERAMRVAARRQAEKEGKVRKGDGKEVDHKKPLSRGGTNEKSNLRVVDRYTNRSYKRGKDNKPR